MTEKEPLGDELFHYGILRRSGRYPWGSGANPYQRGMSFFQTIKALKDAGMSESQIAASFSDPETGHVFTTTQLRATTSIAKNEVQKHEILQIIRMKEKGMSNVAIGARLGIPESTVRNRLKAHEQGRKDIIMNTADLLKDKMGDGYLDIGKGASNHLGVSPERLKTAVEVLKEQGYEVVEFWQPRLGQPDRSFTYKYLAPPGTTRGDILSNLEKTHLVPAFSEDGGRTFQDIKPPTSVKPDRVQVVYGEDGGAKKDGLIELRAGTDDLLLGTSNYAQVRIKVGDGHYLKGMAVYSQDLPPGVDIRFNTNKSNTGNKLDAMKELETDPKNPFKTTIRQSYYEKDGKQHLSPINIVGTEDPEGKKFPGEEGAWAEWSTTLSSQMLSKQTPSLAKQQMKISYDNRKAELDTIKSLTNPTVRQKLLLSYADSVDAMTNKLKAAALPGTKNHVILPVNSLKDDEVYAPNYKNGELVVLIRHPHGGIFEIPQLKVNNKNQEAIKMMGKQPIDAIGINSTVAQQLSGADFDGDTVLVIPTDGRKIKTKSPLEGLKDFDPMDYQDKSLPKMSKHTTQTQMGMATNLISDMTIKGATEAEITNAVKHSMVVIDARKHQLDYKQSAIDHDIPALKRKYQLDDAGHIGADTIVSKSSSDLRVPKRKLRTQAEGGPIDPKTGRLVYVTVGGTYVNKKGETVTKTSHVTPMAITDDARSLVSKHDNKIETIYADYANGLKGLANEARKEYLATPNLKYSPSAKKTYQTEVDSLTSKLNVAMLNKPLERHAHLVGNINVANKKASNPDMSKDELKKLRNKELAQARVRLGAKKQMVDITPKEWEAIQAGAVSNHRLTEILNNTDLDVIKKYALPKESPVIGAAVLARAKSMANNGYTQAEIASALGISTTAVSEALKG